MVKKTPLGKWVGLERREVPSCNQKRRLCGKLRRVSGELRRVITAGNKQGAERSFFFFLYFCLLSFLNFYFLPNTTYLHHLIVLSIIPSYILAHLWTAQSHTKESALRTRCRQNSQTVYHDHIERKGLFYVFTTSYVLAHPSSLLLLLLSFSLSPRSFSDPAFRHNHRSICPLFMWWFFATGKKKE